MPRARAYSIVTPARDEAVHLRRLARDVAAQTLPPREWVVVDDRSTDGTAELARELALAHLWIHAVQAESARDGAVREGRREGRDVTAFLTGLAALDEPPELIAKLDADVSIPPDYFERLVTEFEADGQLGIAGGTCYERDGERWTAQHVTAGHVRGAARVWRWACLEDVLPLEERLGWDGVDEAKAAVRGWTTRSFAEPRFYHHRRLAAREGSRWRAWSVTGATAHYLGSRPSYVVLRALHHARREPAALALVAGYVFAAAGRDPQCADAAARAHLRRQQRVRNLPLRIREAIGRPAS